jgi:hypothetical protein
VWRAAIVLQFALLKLDCFQMPARSCMECVTYDHEAQWAQGLMHVVDALAWAFEALLYLMTFLITRFNDLLSKIARLNET